jgi:TonB family protein
VNLARAIVTFGVWGLAASRPAVAQQAASPVSAGSPGVARLRLDIYVAPVYRPIAQSAHVSGEVVLDATIGSDGRPGDLRVLHSIPLLDQAAIDAVRQWRFEPPTARGASAPIRAPITIVFRHQGVSPSLPINPAIAQHNPSLPRDFAIVVASNWLSLIKSS